MTQAASAASALGYALTGQQLDLPVGPVPDAAALVALLSGAGWTRDRIAAHARAEQESGRPWPHPLPSEGRGGLGVAQFHAALAVARRSLGLDGLIATKPSGRTQLTADERRLLADVPPHAVQR